MIKRRGSQTMGGGRAFTSQHYPDEKKSYLTQSLFFSSHAISLTWGKTVPPHALKNGSLRLSLMMTLKFLANHKTVFQSLLRLATPPPISYVDPDKKNPTNFRSLLNFQTYRNIKFLCLSLSRQFLAYFLDTLTSYAVCLYAGKRGMESIH